MQLAAAGKAQTAGEHVQSCVMAAGLSFTAAARLMGQNVLSRHFDFFTHI